MSVSSPLVSCVCELYDGPCLSPSSTSFSSVNVKTHMVHQIRQVLNQIEARNTNYSLTETTTVLPPSRKRNDTRTPSDDQWHESQWQQDRRRTNLKGTNLVKNLESARNNTRKFFIWTQILLSTNACSKICRLRPLLGKTSVTSSWAPNYGFPAPANNYVTPLQLSINLHARRHIFVSDNSGNNFRITCKKTNN